ncbi:hypothetical protein MTX78_24935 (plasmid) [Hymenobacter tibetensis]|uniref:HTH cro/C1-type domain-containing protein n=1 Tax=Hymenobacter tibetensis TaxID=497967 RepID=A0ABY4D571_9BACT|nr:hypothetical protein [Hymenobacter tibetensis]UOG77658.1 hypothetical protein MTX78_24935 [Hymenobacter tibetensis]
MEQQLTYVKRRRGRPVLTPPNRDLPTELAHLRAWWATHRPRRPLLAQLAREANISASHAHNLLNQTTPSVAVLDRVYEAFRSIGYQPLPDVLQQPAPQPVPTGATFDWFNPLATPQA